MQKNLVRGAIGAVCLSLPVGAMAQGLQEIIITPLHFAQPLGQVVQPTRVITHSEIEATGANTVAGVLQFYPGFQVKRLGGPGQQTSVFMQGTNSNMVKVLINGVPVNDPNSGGVPWSQIPTTDVARIEIISGPMSTAWGADAIGGVINIITRKPAGTGGSVSVSGGDHDTRRGALSLHAAKGGARFGASLSGERTGGQQVIDGFDPRAAYHNRTLNAFGKTRLGRLRFEANLWQSRGRADYVTGGPPYSGYSLAYKNYLDQTARLGAWLPIVAGWRLASGLEQSQHDTEYFDGSGYFTRSKRDAVNAGVDYALNGAHLALGAGLARTRIDTAAYHGYSKVRSAYLQWSQRLSAVTLTAAGRRTLDAQYGGHNTWNLGMAVALPHAARFKLSAGTGFSPPTFLDLYYPDYSNPNLKPETSRSIEAQLLIPVKHAGSFSLSWFRHRLYDLIQPNENYIPENIGNARITGATAGWNWSNGIWNVGAEASWQNPRNLDTGKLLVQRSEHHYTLRLGWRHRQLTLGGAWVYEGSRLASNGKTLEPYRILNLNAAYRFNRHWNARLRIDNALDTQYDTGYYYTGAAYLGGRRSALLTVNYRFGAA